MRHIWLLAACLGLGGCGAPPSVTYFSYALGGVSLVTTGKSLSDHALSTAVEKDCAMWRLLQEQDIKAVCREYADESETAITVAANRPAPQPTTQADPLSQPTVTGAAPPSAGTQVLAAPPAPSRDSIDVKSLFVSLFEASGPRAVAPSAAAGQFGGGRGVTAAR